MEYDNHLVQERVRKLNELKEKDINPFPYAYTVSKHALDIKEEHKDLEAESHTQAVETVAGRIKLLRRMGKASFLTIEDVSGTIQLFFRADDVGKEEYKLLKKLDIGDFIGAKGNVFTTKTGEITIYVEEFSILAKSIRPLPEKYHGLKDTELTYRKRHLDLITNKESMKVFQKRSQILREIRNFLQDRGFLEVETPILHPIYGGAAARPFVTHHNEHDMKLYLRISPELYLKRLIVGGFEKVFDINKNFRNEGIDTTHNPEFTMLELYQSYVGYTTMMELTESLYEYVAKNVFGTTKFVFKGEEVDFAKPWRRVTMLEAIQEHAGIDASSKSVQELQDFAEKHLVECEGEKTWGNLVIAIFEHLCKDKFVNPTFVIDHPKESSPLCKQHREDERLIERFEPFAMGMELANAYSELNDPLKQRELLEDQQRQLSEGNEEANPVDEDFLEAIENGMPPTGGLGIGVDRMVMLMTGQESIRDVILFPTMKPSEYGGDEGSEGSSNSDSS